MSPLIHFISHYGFFGMFIMVAIENIGVPLPTEGAYVVGQALIEQHKASYMLVMSVLLLGHTLGSTISYWAGRRIARDMKQAPSYTDVQKKLHAWYIKHGAITVFATRLIGYVRPWSSYVAGIAEIKFWPFLLLSTVGSLILNATCLAFTNTIVRLWSQHVELRLFIILSFSIGFLLVVYITIKKHMVNRRGKNIHKEPEDASQS